MDIHTLRTVQTHHIHTSSQLCSCFLMFIILITHSQIQRHIHTSTHVWSAHQRNSDNQSQEPGWGGYVPALFSRETARLVRVRSQGSSLTESILRHTHEWVMSHIQVNHVIMIHMNESFRKQEWVMSQGRDWDRLEPLLLVHRPGHDELNFA